MLSLTIACSGHLYKQKTIPRIFLHALISLAQQNASSGILADKRPEKLVPPAFPALQSPIISSLSVCLPSSARFTLCPFAPLMTRPQKAPERFWILCASLSNYCQEACYVLSTCLGTFLRDFFRLMIKSYLTYVLPLVFPPFK